MRAIGIETSFPIEHDESFIAFETEKPIPGPRDLLVEVKAVSVNPVDFKIRQNSAKATKLKEPKILGWDAVGIVIEVGEEVSLFKAGDKVFYAGDITRPGSNAEFQLVDERIVGHCPKNIGLAESAAMPLTAITAWEIFFDRMRIDRERDQGKSLLIIGGAGGVGSIAIQLARKLSGLTVLATASRPESSDWCKKWGADFIVNHRDLVNEVEQSGFKEVDFIVDFVNTNSYWDLMVDLIKPQGHIASITGSSEPVELTKLKTKSVSFSWEFMYTRPMFHTEDMIAQHHLLNRVAELIDEGVLHSTLNHTLQGMTADNFKKAHAMLESGKTIGKIVIVY